MKDKNTASKLILKICAAILTDTRGAVGDLVWFLIKSATSTKKNYKLSIDLAD